MRTKNTDTVNNMNMTTATEPSLPRQVFHHPRQLTPQQILTRLEQKTYFEELRPLPWGLDQSILVYTLFSPVRDQLWLSVEEARALYEVMRTLWIQSGGDKPLLQALSHHDMQQNPIKKAVLLALGPMIGRCWEFPGVAEFGDSSTWIMWKSMVLRSMSQLVLFTRAVEYLSGVAGAPIKMYAQDPWFNDGDETFLRSLGFEVLHRPEAEAFTGADTFVYAPYVICNHAVNSLTRCMKHQPAIYIGHNIDSLVKEGGVHWRSRSKEAVEREVSQLRAWKEAHVVFDVADIGSGFEKDAFSAQIVHVRKQSPAKAEMEHVCTPSCSWVPK